MRTRISGWEGHTVEELNELLDDYMDGDEPNAGGAEEVQAELDRRYGL